MIPYKAYYEYYDDWNVAHNRYIEINNAIWSGGKLNGCDWDFYGVMPPEKEGNKWKIEIECVKK